jgi:transglutaminase-like putative cysteine protease
MFSAPVFLEPHLLRFRPQSTPFHTVEAFRMEIAPTPSGHRQQRDAENNLMDSCWFEGVHKEFRIRAESIVHVADHNPFDFILYPGTALKLPFKYNYQQGLVLGPALQGMGIGNDLRHYGQALLVKTQHNTSVFLMELTQQIQQDFTAIYREVGEPFLPDQTFAYREGSCRDLSWMMIQLLRNLGLAARFVSGYNYIVTDEEPSFELHAWVEVFLPGAGWVGYDPTHGIAVGAAHIPVAASSAYENTMTVSGNLRGDAQAELTTGLQIELL